MSEWIRTAKVGDKVCHNKNHGIPKISNTAKPIDTNKIYTIRAIQNAMRTSGNFQIGLTFEEIINETVVTLIGPWELDYDYRCFRPVQSRQTDISIFHRMLITTPAKESA